MISSIVLPVTIYNFIKCVKAFHKAIKNCRKKHRPEIYYEGFSTFVNGPFEELNSAPENLLLGICSSLSFLVGLLAIIALCIAGIITKRKCEQRGKFLFFSFVDILDFLESTIAEVIYVVTVILLFLAQLVRLLHNLYSILYAHFFNVNINNERDDNNLNNERGDNNLQHNRQFRTHYNLRPLN